MPKSADVIIIGAGLAGLSLARQLLLETDKTVLVIERRAELPPSKQKVGEATVQLSGFYFAKVLQMEEYLLRNHYMKYNLRFHWKTPGYTNDSYEHYSQSYIRTVSNIPTYQLDRNKFEGELLRVNRTDSRFQLKAPASVVEVHLDPSGPHSVEYEYQGARECLWADWIVDASGRRRFLAKQSALHAESPIRHGASFLWIDGSLDLERLTDLTSREMRVHPLRRAVGHFPTWLATNHFVGEGFWLWVIPLHGKTSLGVVYDNRTFPHAEKVRTPAGLIDWISAEFPLFARRLSGCEILDHGSFLDYAYDAVQTVSADRWAMTGDAGRFSDPLYSPGGDLISLHNTLITHAIAANSNEDLVRRCWRGEALLQAFHKAYVPSYSLSYNVLGDQEVFSLKYGWELSAYFGFFVFPFMNGLFTNDTFFRLYFRRVVELGRLNLKLQQFLSDYYEWKKQSRCTSPRDLTYFDFTNLTALQLAEKTFSDVSVTAEEAASILDQQSANIRELAQFIHAHAAAVTVGDPGLVRNRAFVEAIGRNGLRFDPTAFVGAADEARTQSATFLVPVPLHRKRLRHRHFNQAGEIARALAAHTGQPVLKALSRTRQTETQTLLSRKQRMANLRGAFSITASRPPLDRGLARRRGARRRRAHHRLDGSRVRRQLLRGAGFREVFVVTVMRG